MRDVTTEGAHARETDGVAPRAVDLAAGAGEGTGAAGATPAGAGGSEGWLPTFRGSGAGEAEGWLPTLAVDGPSRGRGVRTGTLLGLGGAALLVLGGGALLATRLPSGTTLAGAPVSSSADAPQALAAADAALDGLEVAFTTDVGTRVVVRGADLGLTVDEVASATPVGNGLPALGAWLRRLPEGPQANPVVTAALAPDVLLQVAEDVSTDPVNADVEVQRAGVDVTPGSDGLAADPGAVGEALSTALDTIATAPPTAWPATLEVAVPGTPVPPPVTQADIDQVSAVIDQVEGAGVILSGETPIPPDAEGEGSASGDAGVDPAAAEGRMASAITLTGAELRTMVEVEAVPDAPPGQRLRLVPDVEAPPSRVVALLELARIPPALTASVEDRSPTPGPGPDEELTDVSTVTGTVVAGATTAPGFEPDRAATLDALVQAALAGGGTVEVIGAPEPTPSPADIGIVEPVSTFTTFFPAGQSRVQNIHRIADIVDGTVIQAGQAYELNHTVGERTTENGFTLGGAIAEGELVSAIGGGVSQFATTFFNAAWFSGIELVDWKAHSIYFDRYPAGREATINFPNVNLEIRNDTPHAILVDTAHTPSSVTVTFWSTPHWDVETVAGPCGCGGSFSIDVDRIRTPPSGPPIRETWTTSYTVPR